MISLRERKKPHDVTGMLSLCGPEASHAFVHLQCVANAETRLPEDHGLSASPAGPSVSDAEGPSSTLDPVWNYPVTRR